MKKFIIYLCFCVLAVFMILLRPFCAGAINFSQGHPAGCTYNAIQRVIKKNDSHDDAIEVTEIRRSASIKVILPPVIHPYDFLSTETIIASSTSNPKDLKAALSAYNTYFQVTSRLRV